MEEIYFCLYEFLTVAIPALLLFLFLRTHARKHEILYSWKTLFYVQVFALYIFLVFYVTGAGRIWDLKYYLDAGDDITRLLNISLIPFDSVSILGCILNIVMCVPFGFLLPLIWPKTRRFSSVALSGFLFSLLIEVSQLLNLRASDIDDLIMNTIGAIIGYLCSVIYLKILDRLFPQRNKAREQVLGHEHWVYILIMFLGHFFLFNWMALLKLLYE